MKKIILILTVVMTVVSARGESISQKEAMHYAQLFFNEAAGRVTAPPKLIYNGKKLTTARLFTPFYVFNTSLGGFVIISADNKAYPILGFSLKESFNPEELGDTETALLKSYAREIELVRYDSEPIDDVIEAWVNYPQYVKNILTSHYVATDPLFTIEEAARAIDIAEENNNAVYSDIYTPDQWQSMIKDELLLKQSVPLLFWEGKNDYPAVVYGHQGDYFRIEMTKRNNWLMRLNATDVISANMVSTVVNPIGLGYDFAEEIPFEEFDSFVEETIANEDRRRSVSSIDRFELADNQAFARPFGGGRYEIVVPEEAIMATVYNISGSMVGRFTFSNTNVLNIDISAEPRGFYFVTIAGESGEPYGIKIYR